MYVISKSSLPQFWCVNLLFKRAISSEMKEKLAAERKKLRDAFEEKEKEWESLVDRSLLHEEDIQIYEAHKEASQLGRFSYDDPSTGRRVMTRRRHFYRGSCCGNICRHCIYSYENVAEQDKGKKIFNSAFFVEKETRPDLIKRFASSVGSSKLSERDNFRSQFRTSEDESVDPLFFKH